jgi:mxaJ protein
MIESVASGELDVALAWGPPAGYFAKRQAVPIALTPARAPADLGQLPFEYSMAMGVRKSDPTLHGELDSVLERRRSEIDAILAEYGVPRVAAPTRREGPMR